MDRPIASGHRGHVNIAVLPPSISSWSSPYDVEGARFGLATFAALLPHATQRLAAVPMGLAVAWLGCGLRCEPRKTSATTPLPISAASGA
jgi:hypothetical protein